MALTVGKLHKILTEMVADGQARRQVCVSKTTFYHPLESDGVTVLPVEGVKLDTIELTDADGFADTRKDGRIKIRKVCLLYGGHE